MTDFAYWRMNLKGQSRVHGTFGPPYWSTYCAKTVYPETWERTGRPISCRDCKAYLDTNYPCIYQPEEKEVSHGLATP